MFRLPQAFRLFGMLAACLLAITAVPAAAAVQITFYSKELGSSFPHAFVIVTGTLERGGPRIDEDYGFTANNVNPAILMGSVKGKVITDNSASYNRNSDRHFTLTISDAEYDQVMATVERWRSMPQPAYDLGKRNCIHFVAEIAASIGMLADTPRRLMRRPRSYLEYLTETNRLWLGGRAATFHRVQSRSAARPRAG